MTRIDRIDLQAILSDKPHRYLGIVQMGSVVSELILPVPINRLELLGRHNIDLFEGNSFVDGKRPRHLSVFCNNVVIRVVIGAETRCEEYIDRFHLPFCSRT